MSENQNQHAPCPFCGGTELDALSMQLRAEVKAAILCCAEDCYAHGSYCRAPTEDEAIAAAWEAWDAAGKREDAK